MKVYEEIITKRLKHKIEEKLQEKQRGSRKGRIIQDHIFTIKKIKKQSCYYEESYEEN